MNFVMKAYFIPNLISPMQWQPCTCELNVA